MAVFKTDREWSTYQEKQLKALESVEDVLTSTYTNTNRVLVEFDNLQDVLYRCTTLVIKGIDAIWNDKPITFIPDYDTLNRVLDDKMEKSQEDFHNTLEELLPEEDNSPPNHKVDDDDPPYQRTLLDRLMDLNDNIEDFNISVQDLASRISNLGNKVNGYTELMNDTIKFTGASQDEAQQFRRDIVDTVSDLNADVGNLFNPEEVLSEMIAISNRTSISNRDTLEELTTPLMLAQESLDVNTSSMAKTFGKFYTLYNFNAGDMEELVDHMYNLSKGKDVSEQAMMDAVDSLEKSIRIFTKGDDQKSEDMQKDLTSAVAYLQSNYVDPSSYIEDLRAFMSQDFNEFSPMYRKYGNAEDILSLIQSGDIGKAVEAMLVENGSIDANLARVRGVDTNTWQDATIALMEDIPSYEEFLASIDETGSAREAIEDKHVNIADQISNKLSEALSYLATMQENIGIGFTDVASLLYIGNNLKDIIGGALKFAGLFMNGGKFAGLAGALGGIGGVLGVGGALLGVGAIVSSIYDTVKDDEDEAIEGYNDLMSMSSEDAPYGAGKVEVNDPTTGESTYQWKVFSSQEEADAYDAQKVLENEIESDYEDKPWYEKLWNGILTGFSNKAASDFNQTSLMSSALGGPDMGTMEYSDSYYADQRRTIDEIYQGIYDRTQGTSAEGMRIFYYENGLIDELEEARHLLSNLETYEKHYNEGYYYDMNQGKWYSVEGNEHDSKAQSLPEFEVGTNYIPKDQLAYLHEGEAVVPAAYNPVGNMNELERLRQESKNRDEKETTRIVEAILEVSEFLKLWKDSNDRKDMLSEVVSPISQSDRMKILNYYL